MTTPTRRPRRTHPRLHQVTAGEGGAWSCCCGAYGNTGAAITAASHLQVRAQSAFTRLDPVRASACWVVSAADTSTQEQAAVDLISSHRGVDALFPDLRRHLTPFYDRWGILAARMRWDDLTTAVGAGWFPPGPGLLVLRAALSLLGREPIMLCELAQLEDRDRVTLHRTLGRLLYIPGEEGSPL